jgi:hypothetical protein
MSILDLDNDQTLDISAQRLGINADSNARQGELFVTYASKAVLSKHIPNYRLVITDDGTLTSDSTIHTKDDKPSLYPLFENGVINRVQTPYITVENVTHLSYRHVGRGICCGEFLGLGLDKVSGVHIDIHHMFDGAMVESNIKKKVSNGVTFQYAHSLDDSVKFEDTEINFDPLVEYDKRFIRFSSYSQQPSGLKGLCSNCKKIEIYTLDDFPSELWNIFEPHDCLIYDTERHCEVRIPIKTMKKAIAIANNSKRYNLREHILKIKDGARLADILAVKNFPELEVFIIENNNVQLTFVNSALKKDFAVNYARIPVENLTKPAKEAYSQTTDGWYVVMSNRK